MDFANERYVRIYTRDTITWKRLGWVGQNVLMQLTRRLDRAGVLDLADGMAPWEAVAALCNAPEEAAVAGMERCLELGVVVHVGSRLVVPKFVEAQEAKASNAQRQRRHRERQAAQHRVTIGNESSDENNARNGPVTTVTPSLAEPSLAEPSQPEGASDAAGEIYRDVTGNTDLDPVSPAWRPKQADAVLTMCRWSAANGGLEGLRSELTALKADNWLAAQPVHVWAERLGTSKRTTAPDATAFDEEADDFEAIGGGNG